MKRLVLVLLGMFILVGFANAKELSKHEMLEKVIELQNDENKQFSDGNGIWDSYYNDEIAISFHTHYPRPEVASEKYYAIIITEINNKKNRIMFKSDYWSTRGKIWLLFESESLQFEEIAKLDWIYVITDYSTGEFVEVE
jgi:hypothetical protein